MEQALKAFLRALMVAELLVSAAHQSQASVSTNDLELLYGPQTLHGHLGNPQTESIDLTLPAGEYLLVIQNGTPVAIAECPEELSWDLMVCRIKNGLAAVKILFSRVHAGHVWLDGQELLNPSQLNIATQEVRLPVSLVSNAGEASVLKFKLKGLPGSFVNVSLLGERHQNLPPVLSYAVSNFSPLEDEVILLNALSSFDPDGSIANVVVDWGDGNSSFELAASHAYLTQGQYQASITITDNEGLSAQDTFSITVLPKPKPPTDGGGIFFVTRTDGLPVKVQLNTNAAISDPDGQIVRYTWDFGDGKVLLLYPHETDALASINHYYQAAGDYVVKLTIQDDQGLTATTSRNVRIVDNDLPIPQFQITQTDLGGAIEVQFDATLASDENGDVINYRWQFGDGSPEVGGTDKRIVTHTYSQPGDYTIRLRTTDSRLGRSQAQTKVRIGSTTLNSAPIPVVKTTPLFGSSPRYINFDASRSFDLDGNIASAEWSFGDYRSLLNQAVGLTASHTYQAPGAYYGSVVVRDSQNKSATYFFEVFVPFADTERPPVSLGLFDLGGFLIEFDSSSTRLPVMGEYQNFFWYFGDNTSARGRNQRHSYPGAGSYPVVLHAIDVLGDRHYVAKSITLPSQTNDPLVASIYQDKDTVLVGEAVSFDATASSNANTEGVSALWDFGDGKIIQGNFSELKVVAHTYTAQGSYRPTLSLTKPSGESSIAFGMVHVVSGAQPVAVIEASARVGRIPLVVTLDASKSYDPDGELSLYQWHLPNGAMSPSAVTSFTFSTAGTHWVELVVQDNQGNLASQWLKFYAFPEEVPPGNLAPVADIAPLNGFEPAPTSYLMDGQGSHDADGEIVLYEWRWKGQRLTDTGPTARIFQEQAYLDDVVLTVWDNHGATSTATRRVLFLQGPDKPTSDFMISDGSGVKLGLASDSNLPMEMSDLTSRLIFEGLTKEGNETYAWKVNGNLVGSKPALNYLFSAPGTFVVSLQVTKDSVAIPEQSFTVKVPLEACGKDLEGNMCLVVREAPQNVLDQDASTLTISEATGGLKFTQEGQELEVKLIVGENPEDQIELTEQMVVTADGNIEIPAQIVRDSYAGVPLYFYVKALVGEGTIGHGYTAPLELSAKVDFVASVTDISFTLIHPSLIKSEHTLGASKKTTITGLEPGGYIVYGESPAYGFIHGSFSIEANSHHQIRLSPQDPSNLNSSVLDESAPMMFSALSGYWDPPPLPPLNPDPSLFSQYVIPFYPTGIQPTARLTSNGSGTLYCTAVDPSWTSAERASINEAIAASYKISAEVYKLSQLEHAAYLEANRIYSECLPLGEGTPAYTTCMVNYQVARMVQTELAQQVANTANQASTLSKIIGYPVDPYMGDTSDREPPGTSVAKPIKAVTALIFIRFSKFEGGTLVKKAVWEVPFVINPASLKSVNLPYPKFVKVPLPNLSSEWPNYDEIEISNVSFKASGQTSVPIAMCAFDTQPQAYIREITGGKLNPDYAQGILQNPPSKFLPVSYEPWTGDHTNPYYNLSPKRPWMVSFKFLPDAIHSVLLKKARIKTKQGVTLGETEFFSQNYFSQYSHAGQPEVRIDISSLESLLAPELGTYGSKDKIDLVFEIEGSKVGPFGDTLEPFSATRTIQVTPFYDGKKQNVPLYGGTISMYMQGKLYRLLEVLHQNFNTNRPPSLTLPENLTKYPCIENESTDCNADMKLSANDASLPFGGFLSPHNFHLDGLNADIKFFGEFGLYDATCRPDLPPPDVLTYLTADAETTETAPYHLPNLRAEYGVGCQRIFSSTKNPVDGVQKVLDVIDYLEWRKRCVEFGETSTICMQTKPVRQMTRFAKWVQINRMAFDWLTKYTTGFEFFMSSGKGATWGFPFPEAVMTKPTKGQREKYEAWHMNALVFGQWPDGKPIMDSMLPEANPIGECKHSQLNKIDLTCSISGVDFGDSNTAHFGHFHIKIVKESKWP
ncbi:MAG: PKD domain-containing protein [Bdellovibrionales bacterium]|nr:PKD domain-containing protein [Bdellovibrionales bacterium]